LLHTVRPFKTATFAAAGIALAAQAALVGQSIEQVGKRVGPGADSWLGAAAAAQQPGSQGADLVAQAEQEATAWYAANGRVYTLGSKSQYAAERTAIVAAGTGGTATGYDTLEGRIEAAINADQGVFQAAASAGASALSPLAGVVIAGSLLMALCCAWAISRRLAEYR